jgi:hypothetical protein
MPALPQAYMPRMKRVTFAMDAQSAVDSGMPGIDDRRVGGEV